MVCAERPVRLDCRLRLDFISLWRIHCGTRLEQSEAACGRLAMFFLKKPPSRHVHTPRVIVGAHVVNFVLHLDLESLVTRTMRADVCVLVPNPVNRLHADVPRKLGFKSLFKGFDRWAVGLKHQETVAM